MSTYVIDPNYVAGYSTYSRASPGTYFDRNKVLQTVPADVQRVNWNPETGVFEGVLVEPARANYLLHTNAAEHRLVLAQTVRVGAGFLTAGVPYTLSFYGTGTVTLSGVAATTVVGTGTWVRTTLTITPGTGTLTFTPAGDVFYAQFEQGSYPTSWIPTTSTAVTRAADLVGPPGMFQTTFVETRPDYSSLVSYATGAEVRVETWLYRSLVDDNLGNDPPANSDKNSPTRKWVVIGQANPFACLDQYISKPSVGPGPLQTFALKLSGPANVLGLVDVKGTRVHVAFNDGNGNIYTNSTDAVGASVLLTAHPGGSMVSVCVENTGGDVAIGECLAGAYVYLGKCMLGHRFSFDDYSNKGPQDEFGNSIFVEGRYAKRMAFPVEIAKANYNQVVRMAISLRAKPTIYVATPDPAYSEGAIVFGHITSVDVVIPYHTKSLCSIEVLGLT